MIRLTPSAMLLVIMSREVLRAWAQACDAEPQLDAFIQGTWRPPEIDIS